MQAQSRLPMSATHRNNRKQSALDCPTSSSGQRSPTWSKRPYARTFFVRYSNFVLFRLHHGVVYIPSPAHFRPPRPREPPRPPPREKPPPPRDEPPRPPPREKPPPPPRDDPPLPPRPRDDDDPRPREPRLPPELPRIRCIFASCSA